MYGYFQVAIATLLVYDTRERPFRFVSHTSLTFTPVISLHVRQRGRSAYSLSNMVATKEMGRSDTSGCVSLLQGRFLCADRDLYRGSKVSSTEPRQPCLLRRKLPASPSTLGYL